MNSPNQAVLRDIEQWLVAGDRVWLCTILATWGASPRPAGSWLAVNHRGEWSGSVSGGCLEEDLITRLPLSTLERPYVCDYGVTDRDQSQFQLPCGGHIRLLVETLTPAGGLAHIRALKQALLARQPMSRRVNRATGALAISDEHASAQPIQLDASWFQHHLAPQCRVLLVGAGEVARYVAEFATAAGFETTLCEPREVFANGWENLCAPLRRALPDDLVRADFSDRCSAVLALAHDPRVDDMALMAALASDCFYVGAMGSQRTSDARYQRLLSLGLSEQQVARLVAPVGLDIPSKTPPEIAIAVVADLIRARYRLLAPAPDL
ncbi:XdhC family protein [Marinobacter caseinilyticus]|uniref:XdhC family protein n=1 Tax=Marinobacter caseinilyticus TaxID=2692195 RepID=UPI001F35FEB7|nr:XdhC family protein [Marinobacter caseinilyticus]